MDKIKGVFLFILLLILSGCVGETEDGEGGHRIVSLIPSNTEILVELGFEDDLVAVTTEDDYPESVADNENLIRLNAFELDEEQLVTLDPTHIVGHASSASMHGDILNRVSETAGAEVLIVGDAADIDGIYETIRTIGAFLDVQQDAESLISDIAEDMGNLREEYADQTETRDAFIHISDHPEVYTAGAGTFIDDALSWVNIGNAFGDMEDFPSISAEAVVERNPDVIISVMGQSDDVLARSIDDTPGFQDLRINETENQCNIDPDLLTRPGPRIVDGLREAGRCVYE